jgi:hypothetical protein
VPSWSVAVDVEPIALTLSRLTLAEAVLMD